MTLALVDGDPTRELPFAHGGPVLRGVLRVDPADFRVDEELGYGPSGDGEHAFLTIRKRGRNTHEVARVLASLAGVPQFAVGYAGLKDRNALTTQHFSVHLPGRADPDWSTLADGSLEVIAVARHRRKIRRGSLRGNRFVVRVRGCSGDREAAEQRLRALLHYGVPNYFGSQRFGRDGRNLGRAADLFAGRGRPPNREQRGLLLSAARAQLFNLVLAARLQDATWDQAVGGDVMLLAGTQRQFRHDPADPTIGTRLAALDVHPSGPLCGRPSRALQAESRAAEIERAALADWSTWIEALAGLGLDADRRALRLAVGDLQWQWSEDVLQLSFGLTAGAYATAVLRELVATHAQSDACRLPESST